MCKSIMSSPQLPHVKFYKHLLSGLGANTVTGKYGMWHICTGTMKIKFYKSQSHNSEIIK